MDYITDLRDTVRHAAPLLLALSPEEAALQPAGGGWSPKEIIGHLIDSAANNHARFVRGGMGDNLVFPGYDQNIWVERQDYRSEPWEDLVNLWSAYNLHLAHLMAAIPEAERLREHRVHNLHQLGWKALSADEPATLGYLMSDYVGHLRHHLRAIPALRDHIS